MFFWTVDLGELLRKCADMDDGFWSAMSGPERSGHDLAQPVLSRILVILMFIPELPHREICKGCRPGDQNEADQRLHSGQESQLANGEASGGAQRGLGLDGDIERLLERRSGKPIGHVEFEKQPERKSE